MTQNIVSLSSLINDMARADNAALALDATSYEPDLRDAAWLGTDPVLADMYKQYKDTQGQYKKLLRENGPEEPMTQVTHDMLESAFSAYQTRLLEVKSDQEIQARMQVEKQALEQARAAAELENAEAARAHRDQIAAHNQDMRERRQVEEKTKESLFDIVIAYWLLSGALFRANKQISLYQSFSAVSAVKTSTAENKT